MADTLSEGEAGGSERIYQISELRRYDGREGQRKLIAYRDQVYDVTNCPKWRGELHEQLHFPAQDLTDELAQAPHGEEVFRHPCAKRVGRLSAEGPPT
jgi:predicted heme/steroid binding protein